MINRSRGLLNTNNLRRQKLAWDLVHSPIWFEYLLPLLQERQQRKPRDIDGLDDAFRATREQGASRFSSTLLSTIQRDADSYQSFVKNQSIL